MVFGVVAAVAAVVFVVFVVIDVVFVVIIVFVVVDVVVVVVVVVVAAAKAGPPAVAAPPGSAYQSPVRGGHRHLTSRLLHLEETRSRPPLRGAPGVLPPRRA